MYIKTLVGEPMRGFEQGLLDQWPVPSAAWHNRGVACRFLLKKGFEENRRKVDLLSVRQLAQMR